MAYHNPVLLVESIRELSINPEGIYVDLTFGGGGHSREILSCLNDKGRLIAFDQDLDAKGNLIDDGRFMYVHSNFCYLKNQLRLLGIDKVDGILADLGVSSHHLNAPERGFSFRFPEVSLDMRMNIFSDKKASDIINEYDAKRLQKVFSVYGEIRNAKTLSLAIVSERERVKIEKVGDFVALIDPFIRGNRNRYLAQVFQALRIELNEEIETLKSMLRQSLESLKKGGRLVVISYHSLEDRVVKQFMKTGNVEGILLKDEYGKILNPLKAITKKVIVPTSFEIRKNNRARSAKLRAAEKKE